MKKIIMFFVRNLRHLTWGRTQKYLRQKYDEFLEQQPLQRTLALEKRLKYLLNNIKYEIADGMDKVFLPKIMTIEETLDEIVINKKSICRFGDGEFRTLLGDKRKYFGYERNVELQKRLKEVLQSNDDNILVCIWGFFGGLDIYTDMYRDIARVHMCAIRDDINKYLSSNYKYGNAFITRPYLEYRDKSSAKNRFDKLKQIWDKKDIIIIEGVGSRLGVANDLFDNAKSVERVLCPAENAFAKYNEILEYAKTLPKDKLILIALGMTATVLAYDLAKCDYWAIDIGHVDIEYEWFLAGVDKPMPVKDKYVFDAGSKIVSDISDEKYKSQIIKEIK